MIFVGVILAAGEAQRMGRAKALLPLGSMTMLDRAVELMGASPCCTTVVVTGAHPIGSFPAVSNLVLVHNPDWRWGPLSSLQVGLRAAIEHRPECHGVLVHHVERPSVRPATVAALFTEFATAPDSIWQPRFEAASGHPILWPRAAVAELLALDPTRNSARSFMRAAPWAARRQFVTVDDSGVMENIDTPADYERLCATLGVVPWSGR